MYIAAAAAAGGLAAAAYLDGKYQLGRELNYVRKLKQAEKAYAKAGTHPYVARVWTMLTKNSQGRQTVALVFPGRNLSKTAQRPCNMDPRTNLDVPGSLRSYCSDG